MGRMGPAYAVAQIQRDEHRSAEGAARTSDRSFRQLLRVERERRQQVYFCKGRGAFWAQGWGNEGNEAGAGGGMCSIRVATSLGCSAHVASEG